MSVVFAAAVGILFGTGAYLLLKADLFRVVVGVILIANAANLALLSSGRSRGSAPIEPVEGVASDPLVQAMTITAIVIGFATATLLFSIVYAVYRSRETIDLDELSSGEVDREERLDRGQGKS